MEDKIIKLLYINSKVHSLININQSPAGETGIAAVTQPIAANSTFFITMLPLKNANNFVYLPYTRRISISSKGMVFDNDGLIDICVWPNNIIELNLYPQAVYKGAGAQICPALLAVTDFYIGGEKHTAFIYNEAYSSFVVEHAASGRLKFIAHLPYSVVSAEIGFYRIAELPIVCATGKTAEQEHFIYVAQLTPEISTAICTVCAQYNIEKDSIFVVKDGLYRQVKTKWEQRNQALVPIESKLGWHTCGPITAQQPAQIYNALLEAIKEKAPDIAMACLTRSLAEGLSFSDLVEFFGDFESVAQTLSPACGQEGIALKYSVGENLYSAREFCVETKKTDTGLLIDNICEP